MSRSKAEKLALTALAKGSQTSVQTRTGPVRFLNLTDNNGQTIIDGGKITTNLLRTDEFYSSMLRVGNRTITCAFGPSEGIPESSFTPEFINGDTYVDTADGLFITKIYNDGVWVVAKGDRSFKKYVYKISDTGQPDTPTGASYDNSNNFIPPNGWLEDRPGIPSGTNKELYESSVDVTQNSTTLEFIFDDTAWSTPVKVLEGIPQLGVDYYDGISTFTEFIFSKSSTANQDVTVIDPNTQGMPSFNYTDNWKDDPEDFPGVDLTVDQIYISKGVWKKETGSGWTLTNNGWTTPSKWNGLKGIQGIPGFDATVTDNGDGTYVIHGQNGDITISDGAPGESAIAPTVTTGTDSYGRTTYTVTTYNNDGSEKDSAVLSEPLKNVDYYDGVSGNFISFIFKVDNSSTPNTPTDGSFDGVNETVPTGWTDTPTHTETDIEWVSKRVYTATKDSNGAETWAGSAWAVPTKFYQRGTDGLPGTNGNDGFPGADGTSSYFHLAYADNSDGSENFNQTGGKYIGTYVDSTQADSTNYQDYNWVLVKGADGTNGTNGIAGTNGTDGETSYLHIKYSNDNGSSFTTNSGETVGTYIGTYVDFTLADSTDVNSYKWAQIKGADGTNGTNGDRGAGIFFSSYAYHSANSTPDSTDIDHANAATPGDNVLHDRVVFNGGTYPAVVWDGTSWQSQTAFIDGNALVNGTIMANKLVVSSIATSSLNNNAGWTDDSAANSAQTKADQAYNYANNADAHASDAYDHASDAHDLAASATQPNEVAAAINNNTTTIDGAKITTGTILADRIANGTAAFGNNQFYLGTGSSVNYAGTTYSGVGIFRGYSSTNGVCGVSTDGFGVGGGSDNSNGVMGDTGNANAVGVGGTGPNASGFVGHKTYGFFTDNDALIGGTVYPFTGAHMTYSPDSVNVGDIIIIDDAWVIDINQTLAHSKISTVAKDAKVFGAVTEALDDLGTAFETTKYSDKLEDGTWKIKAEYEEYLTYMQDNNFKQVGVNALGEGGLNVCEANGDINRGDFLCSSDVAGKAMKQDDDVMHSYTVAKALESCIWSDQVVGEAGVFEQDGVLCKTIAVTYHSG